MNLATLFEFKRWANAELADLRLQVRNLERLLGQRTLEIALLREKLGKVHDDDALA